MLPRQTVVFDEHRNSSRVFPVPPNALPDAIRALAALRRDQPELVAWIEAGHPTPTDAQHVAWFGHPYKGVKAQRAR